MPCPPPTRTSTTHYMNGTITTTHSHTTHTHTHTTTYHTYTHTHHTHIVLTQHTHSHIHHAHYTTTAITHMPCPPTYIHTHMYTQTPQHMHRTLPYIHTPTRYYYILYTLTLIHRYTHYHLPIMYVHIDRTRSTYFVCAPF